MATLTLPLTEDQVADRLDRAVAGADLSVSRPAWWPLAGLLQSALALAVAAGAVWLGALAVFGWFRVEDVVPLPEIELEHPATRPHRPRRAAAKRLRMDPP